MQFENIEPLKWMNIIGNFGGILYLWSCWKNRDRMKSLLSNSIRCILFMLCMMQSGLLHADQNLENFIKRPSQKNWEMTINEINKKDNNYKTLTIISELLSLYTQVSQPNCQARILPENVTCDQVIQQMIQTAHLKLDKLSQIKKRHSFDLKHILIAISNVQDSDDFKPYTAVLIYKRLFGDEKIIVQKIKDPLIKNQIKQQLENSVGFWLFRT